MNYCPFPHKDMRGHRLRTLQGCAQLPFPVSFALQIPPKSGCAIWIPCCCFVYWTFCWHFVCSSSWVICLTNWPIGVNFLAAVLPKICPKVTNKIPSLHIHCGHLYRLAPSSWKQFASTNFLQGHSTSVSTGEWWVVARTPSLFAATIRLAPPKGKLSKGRSSIKND